MNIKKNLPYYILAFFSLLFSCKKELYNKETKLNNFENMNSLKSTFFQKNYDKKLNETISDSIILKWVPDWKIYTESNLGDTLTYYNIQLNPTAYNTKTRLTNSTVKEVNIKKVLLIGKSSSRTFYRIATYFFGGKDSIVTSDKNLDLRNLTGNVLYENLDKNSFSKVFYKNGIKVSNPNTKISINSTVKPNYLVTDCYTEMTCSYFGYCNGDRLYGLTVTAVSGRDFCGYPNFFPSFCWWFDGWYLSNSDTHYVCNVTDYPDPPIGGGVYPPGTGPAKPCPGDPVLDAQIARSSPTNINGGRFGNARRRKDGTTKPHHGLDIYAVPNTPLYPIMNGTVVRVVNNVPTSGPQSYVGATSFGNLVEIEFKDRNIGTTVTVLYGHLNSTFSLKVGDAVTTSTVIGLTGRTGNQYRAYKNSPHVHIQVKMNGSVIDPEPFLRTKFTSQGDAIKNPC